MWWRLTVSGIVKSNTRSHDSKLKKIAIIIFSLQCLLKQIRITRFKKEALVNANYYFNAYVELSRILEKNYFFGNVKVERKIDFIVTVCYHEQIIAFHYFWLEWWLLWAILTHCKLHYIIMILYHHWLYWLKWDSTYLVQNNLKK